MTLLFEPFKIKAVEALPITTTEDRRQWIQAAGFNVFALNSDQVTIDLLTDSGTGAMSDKQWGAMLSGDESYAGSRSFRELEATVNDLTGFEHIIPVHQGRSAEHLFFSCLLERGQRIPSNGLFDTTAANIEDCDAFGLNLPCKEALDPFCEAPFKGNIDLTKLEELLERFGEVVPLIVMTITNNSFGGQPVSIENLHFVRKLADKFNILLLLDACRFAENAIFVKRRASGYSETSVKEIARICFDLADVVTFSGKKDGLSNIGGLLCVRDSTLYTRIRDFMVIHEGFPTYGGLAGYSLAAMNQGLKEVLDEDYLSYRVRTIEWAVERLVNAGVPVLRPSGGHAAYIEASKFFPHIPRKQYPGIVLTTELYTRGGIRACELGSVAFGTRDDDGIETLPELDLVRLAFPRRVYTEAHIGYVVETIITLFKERENIASGYAFETEAPVLRHFNSTFKPVENFNK